MSSSKQTTKSSQAARVKKLIAGTEQHFPNGNDPLPFGNTTRTVTALVTLLQTSVDLRSGVDVARATLASRVAAENAQEPALRAFAAAYTAFLRSRFGNEPQTLADFGIAPRKARAPITVEQAAVAVAKREATRAARHTMGPKKKKAIKGNVTATIVVTPLASVPVAPAPAAAATNGAAPRA